jgi:hypothetical protein
MSGASAQSGAASGESRRLAIACIALMALGAAAGIVVPAGAGWDFANFYDTGRRVAAGQTADLYHPERAIAGQPPQGTMAFWGTPLSAFYYVPLAALSPGAALVALKLQVTLALAVSLALVYRLYRRFAGDGERYLGRFCLLALLFQPLWTVYRTGGQTTPTVLLLLVAALWWQSKERPGAAAAAYAVAVTIKPALALGLGFAALFAGRRFLVAAAAAGGALGALSLALFGWPVHAELLSRLRGGYALPKGWHYNSSLAVPLEEARAALAGDGAARVAALLGWVVPAVLAAVAVSFALLALRARGRKWGEAERGHYALLLSLPFFLLASRTVWEHYLMLLLPPLALLVARAERLPRGGRGLLVATVLLSLGQSLVVVDFARAHLANAPLGAQLVAALLKAAPLALAWALVWRCRDELVRVHDPSPAWR